MRREEVNVVINGMNFRGRDFVDLLDVIGALRAADYDEAADQLVRLRTFRFPRSTDDGSRLHAPPDTTTQRVREQLLTGAAEAYLDPEPTEPDERRMEPR